MKKFLGLLIILIGMLSAQTLYTPFDVKKAYKNQTRSLDGKPGPRYWQNHASYIISVSLTPPAADLKGSSKITYFNNSPDTLKELVFRLYPNLFKNGAERDFSLAEEDLHAGVEISSLKISGVDVLADLKERSELETVLTVKLQNQLFPGSNVTAEIEWSYPLPSKSNVRMGRYDSTSYFVAYWYPQIAVYDDVFGWDKIPYTGQKEFYNDFNDYSVTIDLPENFCTWGTGELQNAKEVLPEQLHTKFTQAFSSEKVIPIIDQESAHNGFKMKGVNGRTLWHYKASHVPDFAFALSNHYIWDAISVVVDSATMRKTFVSAAYKDSSRDFFEVAEFAKVSINYFSYEFPKVAFPFPSLTVFNGQGGMEFPMMVNDGSASTRSGTFGVTSHEIAHTYFPFYMGINEKRYAWMDEGWAVMIPFEIQHRITPEVDPRNRNAKGFANAAGTEFEIPLYIPSQQTSGSSYRTHAYGRPAMAYYFLRDVLGTQKFDNTLREFMHRWNGKHPLPNDFFYTFNDVLKEDLSWYWKPWFFESGYPEIYIKDAVQNKQKLTVTVGREGILPVPVKLLVTMQDGTNISKYETAEVWKSGATELKFTFAVSGLVDSILLGDVIIPDKDILNNFKKMNK